MINSKNEIAIFKFGINLATIVTTELFYYFIWINKNRTYIMEKNIFYQKRDLNIIKLYDIDLIK